jgi:hypothetical protein
MNEFPRMIYRAGGTEEIHGGRFETRIVQNVDEQDAALIDGWSLTTDAATATASRPAEPATPVDDDAPPTRAELEAKATDLGIEFSPRIGDAKLAERIAEKLAA